MLYARLRCQNNKWNMSRLKAFSFVRIKGILFLLDHDFISCSILLYYFLFLFIHPLTIIVFHILSAKRKILLGYNRMCLMVETKLKWGLNSVFWGERMDFRLFMVNDF